MSTLSTLSTLMPKRAAALIAVLVVVALAGCASRGTRVVLLPQEDGSPSAVVVRANGADGAEQTIDKPYERATVLVDSKKPPVVDQADPKKVAEENPELFALKPPKPQRFELYFEAGGTQLTADSQKSMSDAVAAAESRSGGELVVTGYTDTVGSTQSNDELSLRRAQQLRQIFIDRGFPAARIEAVGRGERELAVQTADNVDEPRNRRVVLVVR